MKLQEYQPLALATALPSALNEDYLVPGLLSEVGELLGVYAKAVRDEWSADRFVDHATLEYGDIAWMTAVLLHQQGVTQVNVMPGTQVSQHPTANLLTPVQTIVSRAEAVYREYAYGVTDLRYEASTLWRDLVGNCQPITGLAWDEVLQANVDKLAGRAARNTIKGSGDDR